MVWWHSRRGQGRQGGWHGGCRASLEAARPWACRVSLQVFELLTMFEQKPTHLTVSVAIVLTRVHVMSLTRTEALDVTSGFESLLVLPNYNLLT